MELRTHRLILREFVEHDWPAVLEYMSDPEVLRYQRFDRPLGESEVRSIVSNRVADQSKKPREAFDLAVTLKDTGRLIGEFGIGTNPNARICPNMLEAEKAFGTVHFAIGDSYGLGTNVSPHHYDALVERVTIEVNGQTIAREGEFLI